MHYACREEELRRPAPSETLPAVVRHVTCLPVGLPDEPGKREQSLGPGPPGPVSTGGPLARLIIIIIIHQAARVAVS